MAENSVLGSHEEVKTEQPKEVLINSEHEKTQVLEKELMEVNLKLQSTERALNIQTTELTIARERLEKQVTNNEAVLEFSDAIKARNVQLTTEAEAMKQELQSLRSQVKELKGKSRCSCKCIMITVFITVLLYSVLTGFGIMLQEAEKTAAEADQAFQVLANKTLKCGVKPDPPKDPQHPIPDYSTAESRAKFNELGPFSGQDNEILLIRRGPVILATGVYTGQWNIRNETHGFGKCSFINGDIYEGEWRNGVMTGKGRYIWADGAIYMEQFAENKPEGLGMKIYPNGKKEMGMWTNGYLDMFGAIEFEDDSKLIACFGEYIKGKSDGLGLCAWKNGEIYFGLWKAGQKHGQGMSFESDNLYFGNWVNGTRSKISCVISDPEDVLAQMSCIEKWVRTGLEILLDTPLSFSGVDGSAVLNKTRKAFKY